MKRYSLYNFDPMHSGGDEWELLDRLLTRARNLPPSRCLYDGDDTEWCEGFKEGVNFALGEVRDHVADPRDIMEALEAHHRIHDGDVFRCACGHAFATRRDLMCHITDYIADAAMVWYAEAVR